MPTDNAAAPLPHIYALLEQALEDVDALFDDAVKRYEGLSKPLPMKRLLTGVPKATANEVLEVYTEKHEAAIERFKDSRDLHEAQKIWVGQLRAELRIFVANVVR
jgi:hypothetical protein